MHVKGPASSYKDIQKFYEGALPAAPHHFDGFFTGTEGDTRWALYAVLFFRSPPCTFEIPMASQLYGHLIAPIANPHPAELVRVPTNRVEQAGDYSF